MGANRLEVVRLANKHTLYPGQIDRRTPNPLAVLSLTTTGTTAGQFDAIADVALYQDLYARVTVGEAARVGLGVGSTDTNGGWLVDANGTIMIPVRAGDVVEVCDVA